MTNRADKQIESKAEIASETLRAFYDKFKRTKPTYVSMYTHAVQR